MAQIYLPGVGGWGVLLHIKANSAKLELGLSLAIYSEVVLGTISNWGLKIILFDWPRIWLKVY